MHGGSGGISMKRAAACFLFVSSVAACTVHAQSKLSAKWEELTASDFRDAIQQSKGTCLLPFGILEKHGPHLPLGTDLLNVRQAAVLLRPNFRSQARTRNRRLQHGTPVEVAPGNHR
jgi:hypothetical protein